MRIPVFNSDVAEKSISRVARHFKKTWPEAITLSRAQNIVAECLGYADLHELMASLKTLKITPDLQVVSCEELSSKIRQHLSVDLGLAVDAINSIIDNAPLNVLGCTKPNHARNEFLQMAKQQYWCALKTAYLNEIDRPIIIGNPNQDDGIYSVRDIISRWSLQIHCSGLSDTINEVLIRSESELARQDLLILEHKIIKSVVMFPDSYNRALYQNLSDKSGLSTEDIKAELSKAAPFLKLEMKRWMSDFRQIPFLEFYLNSRMPNGFYDRTNVGPYPTDGLKSVGENLLHFRIGHDNMSYDSLPWTIHDWHSSFYDSDGFLLAYADGALYRCKGTYRIDGDDMVYAADHRSDTDAMMARDLMIEINKEFGIQKDYSFIFDEVVIVFLQSWERNSNAKKGLGRDLLVRSLRAIKNKYKTPVMLVCANDIPMIKDRKNQLPGFTKIKEEAEERLLGTLDNVALTANQKSHVVDSLYFFRTNYDMHDAQNDISDFYGMLHRNQP